MTAEKKPNYPLRSIYFYPTESCNLKCIHCWIRPAHAPDESSYQRQNHDNVSVETMDRVVRESLPLGLTNIKFTGGEPFLNPRIFEYLEAFSRYEISFGFETNGTLLNEKTVKKLCKFNVRRLSVSLDGSSPAIHDSIRGVAGSFEKAVNAIQLLIENRVFPQVIFCLHKINAHDLEDTISLAHKLKVKSFEINPLALLGKTKSKVNECEALPVESLLSLEKKIEGELADRYPDMHIDLYLPPALKGIKELSRYGLCRCKIHNICGILSNGDVSICGIGRRKKELIMGNVKKESIAQIWQEGSIFREIRDTIPFQMKGICGKCLFKHQCLGFCRADLLFDEQPLVDSYGICNQVFQKGLFPQSRILTEREFLKIEASRAS